jgi:hypothetical protein
MKRPDTRAPALALLLPALVLLLSPRSAASQEPTTDEEQILALAHEALEAISEEDPIALTDLMIEGAIVLAIPPGGGRPRLSTREENRSRPMTADFVERGFDGRAEVHGDLGTVWLPYDFYREGEWSHCGVDLFEMVRVEGEWMISSLAYTIEQPPDCRPHPDGPPGG